MNQPETTAVAISDEIPTTDGGSTERLATPWPGVRVRLALLLAAYRPASANGRVWTWEEEEADILARECLCCGVPGHYQQQLEAFLDGKSVVEGICVSNDGRVIDGHHRITAARRLGIEYVTLETPGESHERWLRDHGPVSWHERKFGDRHTCAAEPCPAPMHGTR